MSRVTIILPVYNGMPYLPEAVKSILNQTLRDFTLLIIDDGSTDKTSSYLNGIRDTRVKTVHQDNQGLGATLNKGISLCQTEYLARMDADDISLPQRLQMQLEYMERYQDLVMLGTQVAFIAGKKQFSGPKKPLVHEEIQKLLMKGKTALCHGSIIFKTEIAKKIGGYRIQRSGEETDFFLRMCEAGKVGNLDEILYLIRIHRSSTCYTVWNEVSRGKKYAIECANCRRRGVSEPIWEEFIINWSKRSICERVFDRIDCWSANQYRSGLMDIVESKRIRGIIRLMFSAACRPESVARRISGYFQSRKNNQCEKLI